MKNKKTAFIILAAGKGKRIKTEIDKVLLPVAGLPMIQHLLRTIAEIKPKIIVPVIAPRMEKLRKSLTGIQCAIQKKQMGTAHAAASARTLLKGFDGNVVILCGDSPFVASSTLKSLLRGLEKRQGKDLMILGTNAKNARQYGRILLDDQGMPERIAESSDMNISEKRISLCNSGVIAGKSKQLFNMLNLVKNKNAKREYYLTDIVGIARKKGLKVGLIEASEDEVMGINSPEELAEANAIFQRKIRLKFLRQGVSMHDPNSVWFSYDTKIGRNVTIGPNVFFGKNVRIDTGVTIDSFCHMEEVTVGKNSSIGPFSRLRPKTRISANVHIGSFVELKNAKIAEGAKIPHLSYIGDAVIGSEANIGAGTITCNYDGFEKFMTRIGSKAFIGANTSLVAPVKVGDHSVTGAGSTITDDVARHSLALSRLPQYAIKNWSKKNKKSKKKK